MVKLDKIEEAFEKEELMRRRYKLRRESCQGIVHREVTEMHLFGRKLIALLSLKDNELRTDEPSKQFVRLFDNKKMQLLSMDLKSLKRILARMDSEQVWIGFIHAPKNELPLMYICETDRQYAVLATGRRDVRANGECP